MKYDLAQMIKAAGRYRTKTFELRGIKPTKTQQQDLQRLYLAVTRGWQDRWFKRIRPLYTKTLKEIKATDASDLITDTVDEVRFETQLSEQQMATVEAALKPRMRNWAAEVEKWHRARFVQAFTPAGVNLTTLLSPNDVRELLESVLQENVSLIRSLNDQARNGISGTVFRGLQNRTPAREVARQIRKSNDIARRRAELIASDQLQKLTSRLDEERQKQAGGVKFKWQHSGKVNYRDYHKDRNGKVFYWSSSVAKDDPPGRAINCGCKARMILDI